MNRLTWRQASALLPTPEQKATPEPTTWAEVQEIARRAQLRVFAKMADAAGTTLAGLADLPIAELEAHYLLAQEKDGRAGGGGAMSDEGRVNLRAALLRHLPPVPPPPTPSAAHG